MILIRVNGGKDLEVDVIASKSLSALHIEFNVTHCAGKHVLTAPSMHDDHLIFRFSIWFHQIRLLAGADVCVT